MIKNLPEWVLTSKSPAFYDTESGSTIEQTAKVYGAMRELIDAYNNFEKVVTESNTEFANSVIAGNESFQKCVTDLVENYIKMLDDKVKQQDLKIENISGLVLEYIEPDEELAM